MKSIRSPAHIQGLVVALSLVLSLVGVFFAVYDRQGPIGVEQAQRNLLIELQTMDCRWIRARFHSTLEYRAFTEAGCSGEALLRAGVGKAERALLADRGDGRLALRAQIDLLKGRPDHAANAYRIAAEQSDPEALLGLSAALIEGIRKGDLYGDAALPEAIAALKKIPLGPQNGQMTAAVRFNEALLLERLGLWGRAQETWQELIERFPGSSWKTEAEQHLSRLHSVPESGPAISDIRPGLSDAATASDREEFVLHLRTGAKAVREWSRSLFADWISCHATGCADEAQLRARLHWVADILADHQYPLLKATLDAGPNEIGAVQWYRAFTAGAEGLGPARAAAKSLERESNPWRFEAEYLVLSLHYRKDRNALATGASSLRQSLLNTPYRELMARTWWLEALNWAEMGEMAASERAYLEAGKIYAALGEKQQVSRLDIRRASNFLFLGDTEKVWALWMKLLRKDSGLPDSERHVVLSDLARHLVVQKYPEVAADVVGELELLKSLDSNPEARLHRGLIALEVHLELGNTAVVRALAAESKQLLPRVEGDLYRNDLERLVAEANIGSEMEISGLREVLSQYEAQGIGFRATKLYLRVASELLVSGQWREAGRILETGAAAYEHQGLALRDAESRARHFEGLRSLVERQIEIAIDFEHDPLKAFELSERGRSRSFLADLDASVGSELSAVLQPMTSQQISRNLPAGVAVLSFFSLRDRLLGWVVSSEGVKVVESELSQADFREAAGRIVRDAGDRSRPPEQELFEGYETFVRPWQDLLVPYPVVVIVPDLEAGSLPFAALRNPETGAYWGASKTLAKAPSAVSLVRALIEDRGELGSEPVTIFGNPTFRAELFEPPLAELSHAEQESRTIAQIWQGQLFLGADATESSWHQWAPGSQIVHFSGHARANARSPAHSFLVLAPSETSDGVLNAHELRGDWNRTRLVVLSGCETAFGPTYTSEGVQSLAKIFLSRGVSAVVASQWKVDDRATAQLMTAFHRNLKAGMPPNKALQAAQQEQAEQHPYYWAAFEVWGG